MRVAVVGGGITGLAAAYEAVKAGHDVTLYEADGRLGGKILTTDFGGVAVEAGPDAFLARVPHAVDLCRELGLGDDLIAPSAGKAFVWTRGRLRPLPEGVVLGVPTDLVALARSGILSPQGLARAGLDVVLPRSRYGDDPSVGEVIAKRFGREAADRLVEPLLGGIHAGRIDNLSLASTAPQLAGALHHRSLLLGLQGTKGSLDGPVFYSLKGGLQQLVDALADRLPDVRLNSPIQELPDADRVIITTPKLVPFDIEYASVVLVTMAYPQMRLDGSGFLVPAIDNRLMTACSFATNKWPHWAPSNATVLRVSAGRSGDDRAITMSDDDLVHRLHAELTEAIGVPGPGPTHVRVTRWPHSFPQYTPGHAARVRQLEQSLPKHVRIAGAAFHGAGIPACIASGQAAAR